MVEGEKKRRVGKHDDDDDDDDFVPFISDERGKRERESVSRIISTLEQQRQIKEKQQQQQGQVK